jgi:hypothetical protein
MGYWLAGALLPRDAAEADAAETSRKRSVPAGSTAPCIPFSSSICAAAKQPRKTTRGARGGLLPRSSDCSQAFQVLREPGTRPVEQRSLLPPEGAPHPVRARRFRCGTTPVLCYVLGTYCVRQRYTLHTVDVAAHTAARVLPGGWNGLFEKDCFYDNPVVRFLYIG